MMIVRIMPQTIVIGNESVIFDMLSLPFLALDQRP